MADTSLIIGNGNWAVKETSLLGYNIIQSKYVPIEMTVSRNTTATRVNSAGLIELVPRNLLTYSNDLTNGIWTKTNTTIALNTIANPLNGLVNGQTFTPNTTNGDHFVFGSGTTIAGQSYVISFFVKENGYTNCRVGNAATGAGVWFNLSNGTIISGTGGTITALSNGWYLASYLLTASGTSVNPLISFAPSTSTNFAGNGISGGYVFGAQLEQGSTATEYFPTTDRFNIPRVDYSTGTASLLVEPARTNEVLQSGDLSQAVWSKTNYALTSATSIQGLTTTRITKNATSNGVYKNSQARTLNTIATIAAGTKTLTWLIRKGNTDKVGFLINNVLVGVLTSVSCEFDFTTQTFTNISLGLTASFENPTTDVYKIILTINDIGVSTSKAIWIAPIDNSNNTFDGGYLDFAFAQWEAGSTATSYIPTTISALARNADVISKTGISSLIGQTEGTLYFEVQGFSDGNPANQFITLNDGTTNNQIGFNYSQTLGRINGYFRVNSVTLQISSTVLKTLNSKIILKYNSSNVYTLFINGSLIGTGTAASGFSSPLTAFKTSQGDNSGSYNGNIKSIVLYQTALSDPQCIALTT